MDELVEKVNKHLKDILGDKTILPGFGNFHGKFMPYKVKREEISLVQAMENNELLLIQIDYYTNHLMLNSNIKYDFRNTTYYSSYNDSEEDLEIDESQNQPLTSSNENEENPTDINKIEDEENKDNINSVETDENAKINSTINTNLNLATSTSSNNKKVRVIDSKERVDDKSFFSKIASELIEGNRIIVQNKYKVEGFQNIVRRYVILNRKSLTFLIEISINLIFSF